MMDWDNGHMDGGWGAVMIVLMVLLVMAVVGLVVWALRDTSPPQAAKPTAEQVLADRLARGDIDVADYETRLEALRASNAAP
jgi:putative membrane protein